MKNMKNQVLKKKIKKKFLIICLFVISNIYIYLYINLNPITTDLRQRSNFFSFPIAEKLINNESSELIYGSEKDGSIMTSIKISKRFFDREFVLKIRTI